MTCISIKNKNYSIDAPNLTNRLVNIQDKIISSLVHHRLPGSYTEMVKQ